MTLFVAGYIAPKQATRRVLRLETGSAYRAEPDGSISHQCKPGDRFKLYAPAAQAEQAWYQLIGHMKAEHQRALDEVARLARMRGALSHFCQELWSA